MGLCHFNHGIYHRACISAFYRIAEKPVLPADGEWSNGIFAGLCWYMDNLVYTQDIFILIFCQRTHKYSIHLTKDENKRFTSSRRYEQTRLHRQAITVPRHSVPDYFGPSLLSAFQAKALRRSYDKLVIRMFMESRILWQAELANPQISCEIRQFHL